MSAPLVYNDDPIIAGKGSAIFWHLAQPDWRGTEGCVAIERDVMLDVLRQCGIGTAMSISG